MAPIFAYIMRMAADKHIQVGHLKSYCCHGLLVNISSGVDVHTRSVYLS